MRIYAGTSRNHRATKSGKFPPENPLRLPRSGLTAHSPLINCACSYVPSTDATSRPTVSSSRRRFTSPKKLPQKARLPLLTAGREVTPTRFLSGKETGHRAYYGPGVRRLGPQGFRQPPQGNRVRDDYGRAYTRPRPKQAKRLGRPVSCPRPAGKSPNGIPP